MVKDNRQGSSVRRQIEFQEAIIKEKQRVIILDVPGESTYKDNPYKLWSLFELLRVHAEKFIDLGECLHDMRVIFWPDTDDEGNPVPISDESKQELKAILNRLLTICRTHDLPVSQSMITDRINGELPTEESEYNCLIDVVRKELQSKLFLFIPSYRAIYHEKDDLVSDIVKNAFPSVTSEIRSAANCFASALPTACVFHAMRASEIGIKALGKDLKIVLPKNKPIKFAQWGDILAAIENSIKQIQQQTTSAQRNEDLAFYSEAAAQFMFFKNAWRNEVAHAHSVYTESQAKEVIEHVTSFFEILAKRLSE